MELPKLVVELVGDYSQLLDDINEARKEALKQAKLIERDFVIRPKLAFNAAEIRTTTQGISQTFQESLKSQKIDITPALTFNQNTVRNLGRQVSQGLAQGINSEARGVKKASSDLAGLTIDETKRKLKIKSPSQEFRDIGKSIVDGLTQGLGIGGALTLTGAISGLITGIINAARSTVQTGLNFTGDSINKFSDLRAFEAQLKLIEGSENSLKFVRGESDRLSLSLTKARQGYVGLAAAARGTKLQDDVKDIFSSLSTATRVYNLSNEQYQGALLANQQIISKNKVSSEELVQQLGERLPGAVQVAARALGITTAQLDKILSTGQLTANVFLPRFAAQLKKELGAGVQEASNNSTASLTRLQNQVISLQESLGQSIEPGVIAGLNFIQQVLTDLNQAGLFNELNKGALDFSEYLKQNPQIAKETAKAIAELAKDSIKLAAEGAKFLLDYLKENPDIIRKSADAMSSFTSGIKGAVISAKELIQPLKDAFDFLVGVESKLKNSLKSVAQDTQKNTPTVTNIDQVSPVLRPFVGISQALGLNKEIAHSPIRGVNFEQLLKYVPTRQQGFYGVRDGGRRQHSKVDFDSRVGAGEGAIAQAIYGGQATYRPFTNTSAGVFVKTLDQQGREIVVEYGHLKLNDVRQLFGNRNQIKINPGQALGRVTKDALSSGPHLDFGIRVNGQYVDPQKYLRELVNGTRNLQKSAIAQAQTYGPPLPTSQQLAQIAQYKKAIASYYGRSDGFHGKPTASGAIFNADAFTVAHKTLPFGTKVEFRNPQTGVTAIGTINDRGPFIKGREFDLSEALARKLGTLNSNLTKPNVEYRIITSSVSQNLTNSPKSSVSPQQQPPEIRAILQGQQERDRVARRNALRQTQDQIQVAVRNARDASQNTNLSPTQDERNTRQAQQRLQQIDDQITGLQRQKEDAQSRITINQNQISSGSLTPDVVSELNNQIKLDTSLVKELDNSLSSLRDSRRKTSEEYAKFNAKDKDFRQSQEDLRIFQSNNEVLNTRIANLREYAKLNPYSQELEALPGLEKELALNQQQIKVGQDLLNLESAKDKNEITQTEFLARLNAIKKLNEEELKTIDQRYKLARANEFLRQGQIKLDEVIRGNNGKIERLRLGTELLNYGIGNGDRIQMLRDADLVENRSNYLQQRQQLQERALLENLPSEQIKGARLRLLLRYNERNQLTNAQSKRSTDDLNFNSSGRVNESSQRLISGRAEYLGLFGIDSKKLQRQAAIFSQKIDFRNQIRDLERLRDSGEITADAFSQVKANLTSLNEIKLDGINAQFNDFTEVIKGVKADTEGVFKDFILGTKTLGESLTGIFQSILNNLANLAAQMLTDQLFGSIFGRGRTPDFNPSGGGFNLLGGLVVDAGNIADLVRGSEFYDFSIPAFAKGGMVGDIARGLNKERAMSGFKPHLIIANEGERVLTPEQTKLWEKLNQANVPTFSSGGVIGGGDRLGTVNTLNKGDVFQVLPVIQVGGGSSKDYDLPRFEKVLEAKIQQVIRDERRPGGALGRGGLYDR
ncbi:septal ring lytic transglycosylase RlpA family protein [Nostoc sp. PCC 7107]|uniref:septal ring lytic transglycosylase RlpA family protein n=1 Tax=Nostoc sp. PCC 7107 TaxID=317936 RepID=UPI00029EC58D|nr:septal ring lytic transglycosylase RlpA family protein [Nostoc sp. PCC 7107]AFY45463.1 rare lipoprotein A [Nostoc sp. PCC 7107]